MQYNPNEPEYNPNEPEYNPNEPDYNPNEPYTYFSPRRGDFNSLKKMIWGQKKMKEGMSIFISFFPEKTKSALNRLKSQEN
jgi:hypothetical protein